MSARTLEPTTLTGRVVRLEPLRVDHLDELAVALARPEVFAGGWGGGSAGAVEGADAFRAFALRYLRWTDGRPFLVRLTAGPDAGAVVGTSTLADIDTARETVHLGGRPMTRGCGAPRSTPRPSFCCSATASSTGSGG